MSHLIVIVHGGKSVEFTRQEVLETLAFSESSWADADNLPRWVRRSTLDVDVRDLLGRIARHEGDAVILNVRSDEPSAHSCVGLAGSVDQKAGPSLSYPQVLATVREMAQVGWEAGEGESYCFTDIAIGVQDGIDHVDEPGTSFRWSDLCRAVSALRSEGVLGWIQSSGEYYLLP